MSVHIGTVDARHADIEIYASQGWVELQTERTSLGPTEARELARLLHMAADKAEELADRQ